MSAISFRDLIPFDPTSNNTVISGVDFDLTVLRDNGYQQYSNGTISNGSLCFLTFEPYTPFLLPNGTFVNSTTCYSPINPIKSRGIVGLVFVCLYALCILFTFINLRKHGRLFLPPQKRFRAVGRRWQWYWMLAISALAMISGVTGTDIDRYYLPELPAVLSNFSWFLMQPMLMAVVWESVRHWGSWQERQVIDPNPFALKQDDRRGMTEFYLPLVFYFFAWANFFMVIPRSWTFVEEQRSIEQQELFARPGATSIRFKIAGILLFCAWMVILFSLWHSIHHYKPRNRNPLRKMVWFVRYTPNRFLLTMTLALVAAGYVTAIAWNFDISPLKIDIDGKASNIKYIYGLGWAPGLAILIVQEISGFILPNEDRELIRQRLVRGADIDRELGFVKKPNWWSRLNGDITAETIHQTIARNVRTLGGGGGDKPLSNYAQNMEMGTMPATNQAAARRHERLGKDDNNELVVKAASVVFPSTSGASERSNPFESAPVAETGRGWDGNSDAASSLTRGNISRSQSQESSVILGARPQVIRSMLDV